MKAKSVPVQAFVNAGAYACGWTVGALISNTAAVVMRLLRDFARPRYRIHGHY